MLSIWLQSWFVMWVTFCLLTLGLPLGAYFKVDSVWDRLEESFEGKLSMWKR